MQNIDNIPWVEKYRPKTFDNIVLDKMNQKVFENILKNQATRISKIMNAVIVLR